MDPHEWNKKILFRFGGPLFTPAGSYVSGHCWRIFVIQLFSKISFKNIFGCKFFYPRDEEPRVKSINMSSRRQQGREGKFDVPGVV